MKPFLFLPLMILAFGCASTGDQVLVEVESDSATSFTLEIGPADFGTVAPGELTAFQEINKGDNDLILNGVLDDEPYNVVEGSGFGTICYTVNISDGLGNEPQSGFFSSITTCP